MHNMNQAELIGIGLRKPHYTQVIEEKPSIGWLEVHSEDFFYSGTSHYAKLMKIREDYPISLHGMGLSLGSVDGIDTEHLKNLKELISKVQPLFISEHLSWSIVNGIYIPDIIPVPYNRESFKIFRDNINKTQDFLGCKILIENPASYLEFESSVMEEAEFLSSLCIQTGANILLDVNNIYISTSNNDLDPKRYIAAITPDLVKEIHLAGHSIRRIDHTKTLRVDTHDNHVCKDVWELYNLSIQKFGPVHSLVEWDADIPSLDTLIKEAEKALEYLNVYEANYART